MLQSRNQSIPVANLVHQAIHLSSSGLCYTWRSA
jgi:hypothetical protein